MGISMTKSQRRRRSTAQYAYEPLPTPSSFRVLELLPGVGQSPVSYRLHTADWDNPPAYEAVSYAWGDVSHTDTADCDGFQHQISVNLRDALRAMRFEDRSRMLWVDAVCIAQNNLQERGQQVSHMRLIYKGAAAVLVWLGLDEHSQGTRAFAAMNEIWDECRLRVPDNNDMDESSLKAIDELWDVLPTDLLDGLKSDNPESWRALAWLFSRPWFSRLWVIQEVNSNVNVRVLCGTREISWEIAVLVACYIRRHAILYRNCGFPESNYANAYYLRRRFWHREVSVPSLLHWGRSFQASESLDRVYALLGMPAFTKMDTPWTASYSLDKRILYEVVAYRCILETKDLRVLTHSQHPLEDASFPTWVPQWDRKESYDPIENSLTKVRWNAWGDDEPLNGVEVVSGVLKVTGLVFDVVENVHPLTEDIWSPQHPDQPVLQLWKQQKRESRRYPTGETELAALSLVITTGLGLDLRKASRNRGAFDSDFAAYLDHLLIEYETARGRGVSENISPLETGGKVYEYDDVIRRKCRNRTLLRTKRGYMGLGPACEPGDLVCILQGGDVPFILRLESGKYRLIGDSYVHGIMEGEARKDPGMYKQEVIEIH